MKSTFLFAVSGSVLVLGLSGCGGGGGGNGTGPSSEVDAVPPNAVSSTQSFVDYLNRQTPANDTVEPLTLQQQLPPIDDTIEPTPLS